MDRKQLDDRVATKRRVKQENVRKLSQLLQEVNKLAQARPDQLETRRKNLEQASAELLEM